MGSEMCIRDRSQKTKIPLCTRPYLCLGAQICRSRSAQRKPQRQSRSMKRRVRVPMLFGAPRRARSAAQRGCSIRRPSARVSTLVRQRFSMARCTPQCVLPRNGARNAMAQTRPCRNVRRRRRRRRRLRTLRHGRVCAIAFLAPFLGNTHCGVHRAIEKRCRTSVLTRALGRRIEHPRCAALRARLGAPNSIGTRTRLFMLRLCLWGLRCALLERHICAPKHRYGRVHNGIFVF